MSATLDLSDLFNPAGELRLNEDQEGWDGFLKQDDGYYWENTRLREDDWVRRQPVTERTVRRTIERYLRPNHDDQTKQLVTDGGQPRAQVEVETTSEQIIITATTDDVSLALATPTHLTTTEIEALLDDILSEFTHTAAVGSYHTEYSERNEVLVPDGGEFVTSAEMKRTTCRIPCGIINDIDQLVEADYYSNRSEFIRDACRRLLLSIGGQDHNINVDPPGPKPGSTSELGQLLVNADPNGNDNLLPDGGSLPPDPLADRHRQIEPSDLTTNLTHPTTRTPDDQEPEADEEECEVCPNCESTQIYYRRSIENPQERWICYACQHTFGEPAYRTLTTDGGVQTGRWKDRLFNGNEWRDLETELDERNLQTDGGSAIREQAFTPPSDGQLTVEIDGNGTRLPVNEGEDVVIRWEPASLTLDDISSIEDPEFKPATRTDGGTRSPPPDHTGGERR